MTGNPCTEDPNYKCFLYAFVPQLIYYGYKLIPEQEKKDATLKYKYVFLYFYIISYRS